MCKHYFDTNKEFGVEEKPKETLEVHVASLDFDKCCCHDVT